MKNIKIIFAAVLAMALTASAFAKNARFDGANYGITLEYNDTVLPGDPIFVRMRFENIKAKKKAFAPAAKAELKIGEKAIGTSQFYSISKKSAFEYMAGLPLSSWAKSGEYSVAVTYSTGDDGEKTFALPLIVGEKEFDSGTITLNQTMNNISKNTSPEKVAQSKKLNDIINSINPEGLQPKKIHSACKINPPHHKLCRANNLQVPKRKRKHNNARGNRLWNSDRNRNCRAGGGQSHAGRKPNRHWLDNNRGASSRPLHNVLSHERSKSQGRPNGCARRPFGLERRDRLFNRPPLALGSPPQLRNRKPRLFYSKRLVI